MEAHLQPVPATSVEHGETAPPPMSFEEFYGEHRGRLFTALCLVTGNRHEAEEIMQDAFLRVFEHWQRVAVLEDPESYLFRTAMNVFRNRYRRSLLALRRTLSPRAAPDELAAVESRDEVIRLLRGLAPRERAAVVLTSILDLPNEEAAQWLGIKASTVRGLTSRARAQMKSEGV